MGSVPQYVYGIDDFDSYLLSFADVGYSAVGQSAPPYCTQNFNSSVGVLTTRTVKCPSPETVVYQANPSVGPYCSTVPQPIFEKQLGNGCSAGCGGPQGSNSGGANSGTGSTLKADPVNVSNGNQYEAETDYTGQGSSPLKFVRSYNSLSAYAAWGYGAALYGEYLGSAWSATYFQRLDPVSVTDSTMTYNSVYAHRPDGRVLTFSLYNGVYSSDGDVSDSLVQTASGWQYQTADDTLETYNTAGQLIAIAARGQSPVTVAYASAGGPPSSVTDAFGHALLFSYTVDATSTQRLAAVQRSSRINDSVCL